DPTAVKCERRRETVRECEMMFGCCRRIQSGGESHIQHLQRLLNAMHEVGIALSIRIAHSEAE
ncbi:MAG: hypothetical protein ACR2M1_15095, partial [Gemmatimonadaceae bacterium]